MANIEKDREQQADNIIAWYKGRSLPQGEIRISKCMTIVHITKYVDRSLAVLGEKRFMSREFVASLHRLHDLKKYLETC